MTSADKYTLDNRKDKLKNYLDKHGDFEMTQQATQTEAQRLAEWIEGDMSCQGDAEIAAELRRLDAAEQAHMRELRAYRTTVENLEQQLAAIGAGGVEPLRKPVQLEVPHGWQLVPIEPTEDIEQAAADYLDGCVKAHGLWLAMLAAAPKPPATHPTPQGLDAPNPYKQAIEEITDGGVGTAMKSLLLCRAKELAAQAKQGE